MARRVGSRLFALWSVPAPELLALLACQDGKRAHRLAVCLIIVLAVAAAVAAAVFTVLVKERTKSATIELPSDLHAVHTAEYARALLRGLEKTMRTGGRARSRRPPQAP